MANKRLQWHPSFPNTINIELAEAAEQLKIVGEYPLSEKPLQIDVMIINQKPELPIKKTIGRIFKRYNVVEYKSPEDYVSVNDYYKVLAYSGLYQSLTERVLEISPDDLTVTFVSNHFPRGMISHLKERYHIIVEKPFAGIYYLKGLIFPTQLVIINQLPPKEYVWLSRLRTNLNIQADIEPLAQAYKGHERDPMYAAVMDLIMRANSKIYKEARTMCEALRELFADELEMKWADGIAVGKLEGTAEGKAESILELLSEVGEVPEDLKKYIFAQKKGELLSTWLKLAARAGSIEEFTEKIELNR